MFRGRKTASQECSPVLARFLANIGTILLHLGRLQEAERYLRKALPAYQDAFTKDRTPFALDYAGVLTELANVLEAAGDGPQAVTLSHVAVHVIEETFRDDERLWVGKGSLLPAYSRLLAHSIRNGATGDAFNCLSAMRVPTYRMTERDGDSTLADFLATLASAEARLGKKLAFVFAQWSTSGQAVVGTLTVRAGLELDVVEDFRRLSRELFLSFQDMLRDPKTATPQSIASIQVLAKETWASLPDPVKTALSPSSGYDPFICADEYGTAFPWEILLPSDGADMWLGLHAPLVRWPDLSASSLCKLQTRVITHDGSSALVVCPWDVPGAMPLVGAQREANEAQRMLNGVTHAVKVLLGTAATDSAFLGALRDMPTVIHFTGHGTILHTDELLVFHSASEPGTCAYVGQAELMQLHRLGVQGPLFAQPAFLTLNSCLTGRTREYGGRREDLISFVLREGADAAVASPMPIFDAVGLAFGSSLYASELADNRGLAWTVARARALTYAMTQSLPPPLPLTWALIHYHGNPYLQFEKPQPSPRLRELAEQTQAGSLEDALARIQRWLTPE
jgi:hypothetical protein